MPRQKVLNWGSPVNEIMKGNLKLIVIKIKFFISQKSNLLKKLRKNLIPSN